MPKLSLSQIGALIGADRLTGSRSPVHFCADSRKVRSGSLFFALKGRRVDGHEFVSEAIERGAIAAVVSERRSGQVGRVCVVADVLKAMQQLAAHVGKSRTEVVVAITGSMAKTTTKEFLATLLEAKYRVFRTPGNQNTQVSVPLAILNLDGDYDMLVIEMGMTDHGHITNLVEVIPPDVAMVTRIAPAGIEGLIGGLEAVARAKAEIFSHPKTRLGLVSAQAAAFRAVREGGAVPKVIYAQEGSFTIEAGGIRVGKGPLLPVKLSASHLIENAVGAICAARALGLSWSEIGSRADRLKPFTNRFEIVEKEGVTWILDSYNANPDSCLAALRNLPKKTGRAIGVLGTMPGLGTASARYHQLVGREAALHLDRLLCIGAEAEPLGEAFALAKKPVSFYNKLSDLKKALRGGVAKGDLVLIKGGNALRLWTLMEDGCCCC